ncbi:MAG: sugar phosphate isomerase/epimerase [Chloroflexi bacterium]|nr:sugar phosphate isomerase/epimerase [Chloroflexota bacterium]
MKKSSDEGLFPADWALERRLAALAGAGFTGIEMDIGDGTLPVGSSSAEIAQFRNLVESHGLVISAGRGGGMGADLSSADAGVRSKAIETVEWFLNAVSELGTDAVLMVLGHVTEEIRHDQAIDIARSVVTEILPIAERTGVRLCIEPVWPKFGGSFIEPLGLRAFIDSYDNEFVRADFDVGTVLVCAYPQHWIRILGNRIYRVHVKDFKTGIGNISGFTHLLHGDVPWAQVMEAFREIGYDGWITCELSPLPGDPDEGIRATSHALDLIFAM